MVLHMDQCATSVHLAPAKIPTADYCNNQPEARADPQCCRISPPLAELRHLTGGRICGLDYEGEVCQRR